LELEELGVGEGGWEELDGVVALGLEGVAARLPALAPGPDARASALMEIPRASKAVVTRFLGAVGAAPIVQAPAGRKEKKKKKRRVRVPDAVRRGGRRVRPDGARAFRARALRRGVARARGRARGREGGA
jgi:hypothetical protein